MFEMDSCRRTPYAIATKHGHQACAAILNPSSAEPLVWPLQLRSMTDLNPEAKALLEKALLEKNFEREKASANQSTSALPLPSRPDAKVNENTLEVLSL